MIDKIEIILGALGVVSCVIAAILTGQMGYLVATIWATIALVSHLDD